MTREEIKEAVKVMEAFANGKKVQRTDLDGNWFDCDNPRFDWASFNYRIKSEPKYRPFKTQEECWEEMHKHPDFGWLRCKLTGGLAAIGGIDKNDDSIRITWSTNEGYNFTASNLFTDYEFTDGTPFGKKEE